MITLALLPVQQIMVHSQVFNFLISYVFFGAALINLTYTLAHLFSDPETGQKYLGLCFLLCFLLGPIAISLIGAAIFGFDSSLSGALSFWFYIDPIVCFTLQLYNLCCAEKSVMEDLTIKLNGGKTEITTGLYLGVISYQVVAIIIINVLIDTYKMNSYKR